jgi:hypothetical protein
MEVVSSMKGFEMMIGSLRHSEHNGSLLHHVKKTFGVQQMKDLHNGKYK